MGNEQTGTNLPQWVIQPLRVCYKRMNAEMRFNQLAIRGFANLTMFRDMLGIMKFDEETLRRAGEDADWIKKEGSSDFPLLHAHSTVALWGMLEVLVEDFAVAWLRNEPSAWHAESLAKLQVPLNTLHLGEDERCRVVVDELIRKTGAELRKGLGKLAAVLGPLNLCPAIGTNSRSALHELCQVRNVIVHCAGRVDRKLLSECPWLNLSIGQTVNVRHSIWHWYVHAIADYALRLSDRAVASLGLKHDLNLDREDIYKRPDETEDFMPSRFLAFFGEESEPESK